MENQKQQLASYYKGEAERFLKTINEQFEYRGKNPARDFRQLVFCIIFFPLYETFTDEKMYTFK